MDRLQLCICLSLGAFLESLGAGAGLVYLVVLQETESVLGRFSSGMSAAFLYELPCANQAIIQETKRRVEKQQDGVKLCN